MPHSVFISYASIDQRIAFTVCDALEQAGITCWIAPRDILPSDDYDDAIIDAINHAQVMVLIYTSTMFQSKFVKKEVERANTKGLKIVPFRLEPIPPQRGWELQLSLVQWQDALTRPLEPHIGRLTEIIQLILAASPAEVQPSLTGEVLPKPSEPTELQSSTSLEDSSAELSSEPRLRHNLPLELTPFIGRQREIIQVQELLQAHRLVTLTGSGGVGKTRLSIQVAGRMLAEMRDGIWYVELAPISDPNRVPQIVAAVVKGKLFPKAFMTGWNNAGARVLPFVRSFSPSTRWTSNAFTSFWHCNRYC